MPLPSLLLALTAFFAAPTDAAIAERYLEALYEPDLEALASLTSEDLLFHDATAAFFPSGPWRFEGRDAVIDFFKGSLEMVESSHFEKVCSFTSGEQTIFELDYIAVGDGAVFNAPGVRLKLRTAGVTVITVRDSKVVEHQDFIDYPGLMREVEEQKAAQQSD